MTIPAAMCFVISQHFMFLTLNKPHSDWEKKNSATSIIKMTGKITTIQNPNKPHKDKKKFTFDYCYWSHNSFKATDDGYLEPASTTSAYADQVCQTKRRIFCVLVKNPPNI